MEKKSLVKIFICILVLSFFLTACITTRYLEIQPRVVNLEEINRTDKVEAEFNAARPPIYRIYPELLYATSPSLKEEENNIKYTKLRLLMDWDDKMNRIRSDQHTFELDVQKEPTRFLENKISLAGQKVGPIIIQPENKSYAIKDNYKEFEDNLLYSVAANTNNSKDKFDIYYYTKDNGLNQFAGNDEIANDYYLTYHHDSNTIYFSSDRNGSNAIYSYQSKAASGLEDLLEQELEAEAVEVLNSDYDDKTPYILEDIMLFVSDRDSANGNFNIYFSKFEAEKWSEPQKLPQQIDTETDDSFNYLNSNYNEYRPRLFKKAEDFLKETDDNKVMIFSSNRPGGKGGYDLYLAVLPLDIFD